jgi:hypothetical protein
MATAKARKEDAEMRDKRGGCERIKKRKREKSAGRHIL